MCCCGILLSDSLAFPLATAESWRYLLGLTVLPALAQLVCGWAGLLHESPRWLLARGDIVQATSCLMRLRGTEDVQIEINQIISASRAEQRHEQQQARASGGGKGKGKGPAAAGWGELIRDTSMRRPLVVGVGLQVAQQLSGINAVFYYSTSFFASLQLSNPLVGTLILGAVNVFGTAIAVVLMDKAGRKRLLLWGTSGMVAALVVVTLALLRLLPMAPICALGGMVVYVCCFEIGLGPIPWLITAEMFPARTRASAVSIATAVNWICNFVVGILYPFMQVRAVHAGARRLPAGNGALARWCSGGDALAALPLINLRPPPVAFRLSPRPRSPPVSASPLAVVPRQLLDDPLPGRVCLHVLLRARLRGRDAGPHHRGGHRRHARIVACNARCASK
jgi:sugar porter (SP) family MFS transporter